jgi:hypothetical protein
MDGHRHIVEQLIEFLYLEDVTGKGKKPDGENNEREIIG